MTSQYDQDRERAEKWLREDFVPSYSRTAVPATNDRIAAAVEYMAHHIGQIDKKLDALIEALKLIAVKT